MSPLLGSGSDLGNVLRIFVTAFRLDFLFECLERLALCMCDQREVSPCRHVAMLVAAPEIPNVFPRVKFSRRHDQILLCVSELNECHQNRSTTDTRSIRLNSSTCSKCALRMLPARRIDLRAQIRARSLQPQHSPYRLPHGVDDQLNPCHSGHGVSPGGGTRS